MVNVTEENISGAIPDPNNANLGTERGQELLDQSLRLYGAGRSILLDRTGRIIAGNKTQQSASEAGIDDMIVVETDGSQLVAVKRTDLDLLGADPTARLLAYADNRIGQIDLDWDSERIKLDIESGIDLGELFTAEELEIVAPGAGGGNGADGDLPDTPEAQVSQAERFQTKWAVERGDLWEIPSKNPRLLHRIACGSSLEPEAVKTLLQDSRPFVFTDPPYGIGEITQLTPKSQIGGGGETQFGKKMKIGGDKPVTIGTKGKIGGGHIVQSKVYPSIEGDTTTETAELFYALCQAIGLDRYLIWGGNYFTQFLPPSRCWIVWDKENTGVFADCELAWTSLERGVKLYAWLWNGLSRRGVRIEEMRARVHPTQKPVGLFKAIMRDYPSPTGYFDGFLGSGSTLLAGELTGHRVYGFDISPLWIATCLERASMIGLKPRKVGQL